MQSRKLLVVLYLVLSCAISCKEIETPKAKEEIATSQNFEQEKAAILETLNNETKAAFQRDYEAWQDKWSHDSNITKVYINFSDQTFSESVGWDEISEFVKTYFEEHPEPEPLPNLLDKIDVRLYENGAWVIYEQQDSLRGLKRETRLMEKINGSWKIAGMQTTIYGFDSATN